MRIGVVETAVIAERMTSTTAVQIAVAHSAVVVVDEADSHGRRVDGAGRVVDGRETRVVDGGGRPGGHDNNGVSGGQGPFTLGPGPARSGLSRSGGLVGVGRGLGPDGDGVVG